jgi:hypothetical protein
MAEPNLTVIRGGLLALASAHPRTSLAALLRAASSKIWRSAERPPRVGVVLALLTVAWL